MRLLLNGRFLARPATGVDRLALELARAIEAVAARLPERGVTVQVAVPPGHEGDIAKLGRSPPPVRAIGRRGGHWWEQGALAAFRPRDWLLSLCNVGPVRRRRQAAVICDAQVFLYPGSYSRAFRWWYQLVQPLLARRAAALFTISDYSKRELERFRVAPRGKARVLRLGGEHVLDTPADPGAIERFGLAGRRYVLAIGSLAPHKNLPTLIRAFLAADLADVLLVIAGGGNERVFGDAGLPAHPAVRYLGRVTDAELRALYESTLAFACPSFTEGFGLTPLEAMTCGAPVIATTGGAVPEVCGDAVLYADPADEASWRAALWQVAGDDALRADLSRRGLARAACFSWTQAAVDFLAALAEQDGEAALLHDLRTMRVGGEAAAARGA